MRVLVLAVLAVVVVLPALVCGQQGYVLMDYDYPAHGDEPPPSRARSNQALRPLATVQYNATIQKCLCAADQVWSDSHCTTAEEASYVAVTDLATNQVSGAPIDSFQVSRGAARCLENQVQVTLVPSRGYSHQFSLLTNGSLYWQTLAYEHYCFDHTLDGDGQMTWQANVCLPQPVIPRCCHSLAIASDGSCTASSHQLFSPPVTVNEQVLQWPAGVQERAVSVTCKGYEQLLTLPLNTSEAHLTYASGGVFLTWSPDSNQRDQAEGFCVEPDSRTGGYNASVCHEDQLAVYEHLCHNATCVRKCCPEGDIMLGQECVFTGGNFLWTPSFTDAKDHGSSVSPPGDLTFLYGEPSHCHLYQLDPEAAADDAFLLLNDGTLFNPSDNGVSESFLPTHYCIDNFVNDLNKVAEKALVCFSSQPVQSVCSAIEKKVYPSLLLVSSVFLGITLAVYISVPDIRDRLHGRCLISLVAALFVGYTLLAATRLAAGTLAESACAFLAFVMHLSILAAFFWLNVMCFDIWRTLRKTRTVGDKGRATRRFLLYSLYAWGCPLLLAIITVIVDKKASDDALKPNISKYCWFNGQEEHWVYLYGWVLLLVLANIVFFGLVASILFRSQNDPLLARSREQNRERMWLYVKLFLVMGVTWLAEVISWQVGVCGALIVTDILNALQGFIIFVVFVCKRTILQKVRERWCLCCGGAGKAVSRPFATITTSLSSFSKSSSSRYSSTPPTGKRSFAGSRGVRASNASPSLPLQTLQEAPSEHSEVSPRQNGEGATVIPGKGMNAEGGRVEETTPLNVQESTTPPGLLESHH